MAIAGPGRSRHVIDRSGGIGLVRGNRTHRVRRVTVIAPLPENGGWYKPRTNRVVNHTLVPYSQKSLTDVMLNENPSDGTIQQ